MATFEAFDARGYRTVDVRSGYRAWLPTYEETVEDAMDIALFERLTSVRWNTAERAVDLGCGTGRTGRWLRSAGVRALDGVDLTPEMLTVARERAAHDRLFEADVAATGLEQGAYDLVIASLVDEHLAELEPLYAEARRLAAARAKFVLVGFHPHFIMASGMPTHFHDVEGEAIAIETHVHLLSDHVTAATAAGWTLAELKERVIDDAWLALKPKWSSFRGQPISFAFVWSTPG
jgi:SAM-dependent methyltransferase